MRQLFKEILYSVGEGQKWFWESAERNGPTETDSWGISLRVIFIVFIIFYFLMKNLLPQK